MQFATPATLGTTPHTITPRLPMAHTHYMGLSGSALRTAIGLVAGLCFVAFGYGQGDIGGLMVMSAFEDEFRQIDAALSPTLHTANLAGITVAVWNLGCFVGAMITIFVGDVLGRKGSIMFGLVLMTIGYIIQIASFSLGQYIAGRFVAGFGNGFIASTVPAWQAECLKTHRRGTLLLVSFGSCITAGLAIAYWMDYAFDFVSNQSVAWRTPIALGLIWMIVPLFILIWMPESPRYLILTGRETEAKSVFSALNELPPDGEDIHREFLMVKHTLLHMSSGGVAQAFKMGEYRYLHRTILAVLLQLMQQFTGVNVFMQYLGSMFRIQLHYKGSMSLLLASCCATEFFLASLVAVIGIDRFWGRRTLTMFGAAGMCGCLVALAVLTWAATQETWYAMTAFLFLYCTFFSIGWQGMSWLWAVELIPLCTRGPANALATAMNWAANFTVVMTTPAMFTIIHYRTYIVYAVINAFIVPTIYFLYPETGYRSLEEVDVLFSEASTDKNPWLAVVKVAHNEPTWFDQGIGSHSSISDSQEKNQAEKHVSSGSEEDNWKAHPHDRHPSAASSESSPRRRGESSEGAADAPPDISASPPPKRSVSDHSRNGEKMRPNLSPLGPGAQ